MSACDTVYKPLPEHNTRAAAWEVTTLSPPIQPASEINQAASLLAISHYQIMEDGRNI